MTIRNIMNCCSDTDFYKITVFDCSIEKHIYEGPYYKAPDDIVDKEVVNWDIRDSYDNIKPSYLNICFDVE